MKKSPIRVAFAGFGLAIFSLLFSGCGGSGDQLVVDQNIVPIGSNQPLPPGEAPRVSFQVLNSFPHQTDAYTQGLLFSNGRLYESTGLRGQSSLREVDLATGQVVRRVSNDPSVFAEGLALRDGKLYQLTLDNGLAIVWDQASLTPQTTLPSRSPAWGLTYLPESDLFALSDGTSTLRYLDANFQEVSSVVVTDNGAQVDQLNELEYVDGVILANRFRTNEIVGIDPANGALLFRADLSNLIDWQTQGLGPDDVLNGIAYDANGDRLFVTGKRWPFLYQIRIVRAE